MCSAIASAGTFRSGSVAINAALSTLRVAASSSRMATAVTDVLAARASRSSRFITSSGTLRKCRVRMSRLYANRLRTASDVLAAVVASPRRSKYRADEYRGACGVGAAVTMMSL